MLLRYYLNFTK